MQVVDRDGMRARRKRAKQEQQQEQQSSTGAAASEALRPEPTQPTASGAAGDGEEAHECWICYSGAEAGELVSPCRCRGSMRWVHTACLHRWITTRVTEYSTERMFERGSAGPDRFACPNCETPFEFVDAARGEGGAAPDLIWPRGALLPDLSKLEEIDEELRENYRWKVASPVLCVLVQVLLLGFTACKLGGLWHDVAHSPDGWGEMWELRNLTRQNLSQSPFLNKGLELAFGEAALRDPIVGDGAESIGTISAKWSKTFASIQHGHAM